MNPLTQVRNLNLLNERELAAGKSAGSGKSWHDQYRDSAWIYVGGLSYDLTEGDVITIFSQYGEIENLNLIRDGKTGNSKGFGFVCYEDQRSTILAVDNLNGAKVTGRTVRVDHVKDYKPPKEFADMDEFTKLIHKMGVGVDVNIEKLRRKAEKLEKKKEAEAQEAAMKAAEEEAGGKLPFPAKPEKTDERIPASHREQPQFGQQRQDDRKDDVKLGRRDEEGRDRRGDRDREADRHRRPHREEDGARKRHDQERRHHERDGRRERRDRDEIRGRDQGRDRDAEREKRSSRKSRSRSRSPERKLKRESLDPIIKEEPTFTEEPPLDELAPVKLEPFSVPAPGEAYYDSDGDLVPGGPPVRAAAVDSDGDII